MAGCLLLLCLLDDSEAKELRTIHVVQKIHENMRFENVQAVQHLKLRNAAVPLKHQFEYLASFLCETQAH